MRISWKRMGLVAGVIVVAIAGGRALGTQPYKQYVVKCNPNQCGTEQVCGNSSEVPKLCGETKDGPFFPATFSCCCCTEASKGRWFFGE